MSRRLLVLGYHNIEPTCGFPGSTPERARRNFARQARFLRRWTNVVPLRAALADLAEGRPLPPRAVALTFDDGYLDNVTVAAPVLHAAGLPASFFLVPGFLSGSAPVWWEQLGWAFTHATTTEIRWNGDRHDTSSPPARRHSAWAVGDTLKLLDSGDRLAAVAELRQRLAPEGPPPGRQFMDWDEAGELLRLGHEIESHTCAHPILSREGREGQAHELAGSRRELADHFRRPVDVLAYPNGRAQDYSDETVRLAREAGYAFALTTHGWLAGRRSAPLEIPRVLVDAETDLRQLLQRAAHVAGRAVTKVARR